MILSQAHVKVMLEEFFRMEASVAINNIKGFTDWLNAAVLQQQGADQAGKLGVKLAVKTSTINKWKQGRTHRLSIAYVQNIAKYLGGEWSVKDVKAWLSSPNGTSIAAFKDRHTFSKKEEETPIGGRVQEILALIRSLHRTNGASSEEQLAIITAVVSPFAEIKVETKPDIPPEWVEVVNLFPRERLAELYESGRGIPEWKESIDEVLSLKRLPDRMVVCVMCLLVNRYNPGALRYQPEQIEQILDPLRDSIRLGSKEPSKMDNK